MPPFFVGGYRGAGLCVRAASRSNYLLIEACYRSLETGQSASICSFDQFVTSLVDDDMVIRNTVCHKHQFSSKIFDRHHTFQRSLGFFWAQ